MEQWFYCLSGSPSAQHFVFFDVVVVVAGFIFCSRSGFEGRKFTATISVLTASIPYQCKKTTEIRLNVYPKTNVMKKNENVLKKEEYDARDHRHFLRIFIFFLQLGT